MSRRVVYYKVEQPGVRLVSLKRAEFIKILHQIGYLLEEIPLKGKGCLVS